MLRSPMIRWFSKPLTPWTCAFAIAAAASVCCFQSTPFEVGQFAHWLFVLAFAVTAHCATGPLGDEAAEFLFTRGFRRRHVLQARLMVISTHTIFVWLAAAVPLWSGLRSAIQSQLFENPNYPPLAGLDAHVPWSWLVTAIAATSLLHYSRVRQCLPFRGRAIGGWLVAAWLATEFVLRNTAVQTGSGPSAFVTHTCVLAFPLVIAGVALIGAERSGHLVETQS